MKGKNKSAQKIWEIIKKHKGEFDFVASDWMGKLGYKTVWSVYYGLRDLEARGLIEKVRGKAARYKITKK